MVFEFVGGEVCVCEMVDCFYDLMDFELEFV